MDVEKLNRTLFVLLAALFALVMIYFAPTFGADDAHSYYMAGHFASQQEWSLVYPYFLESGGEARLRYKEIALELSGREHSSPFIYPPLWAKLFSLVSTNVDYALFKYLMAGICACALLCIAEAARQLVAPGIKSAVALAIQLAFWGATTIGIVAINELQFQALVSALIVLAFFSAQREEHIAAGLFLAVAASIKLTPLIFIVLWIAQRNYQPIKFFVLFGVILGLTSILWAGWPAHQLFLESVISLGTDTIIRYTSFSLTAAVGILSSPELVGSLWGNSPASHQSYQFATFWGVNVLTKIFLVALVIWIAVWGQRIFSNQLYVYGIPLVTLAIGLSSPLAWGHHYLAAFAFVPLLYLSKGQRAWAVLFVMGVAATSIYWVVGGIFPRPVVNVAMPLLATTYGVVFFVSLIWLRPKSITRTQFASEQP